MSRVQPEVSTVLVLFQFRLIIMVKEIVGVVGTAAAMASVVVVVVAVRFTEDVK